MTARRRTIGAQLARVVAVSTALGVLVFAFVAAAVLAIEELADDDDADEVADGAAIDDDAGEDEDDLGDAAEALGLLGLAVLIATPFGIAVAVVGGRRAARRVTARLDGVIAAATRITTDNLTERVPITAANDEVDDVAHAFNAVLDRIETGVTALRRFAADASHELRTPLAAMTMSIEVSLRHPRSVDDWERVAGRALAELRAMAELVEALLHTARAGAFDAAAEPVDLDGELAALAPGWRERAAAASVRVDLATASAVQVRIDPRALAIAVDNLVRNAIAHSPDGGTVTIRSAAAGERARVSVVDQGPGVPAAERERIFAPYARGTHAADRRGGGDAGVGLGLSIARRIVEAHGGTIRVADSEHLGGAFVVELPAASFTKP
jgi:two-component system heavy metal sensor histidine kinase CusS